MVTMNTKPRSVATVIQSVPTSDGAGVNLNRSLGTRLLSELDPFLLFDEFRSDNPNDYIAGFPSHPHRGFETVTYMLAGSMQHKDSRGNTGNLTAGSVQWMTAARGILHSEMPKQEDGLLWGFQLWVNLPADEKMKEPHYQDIPAVDIPVRELDNGGIVRVIAGKSGTVEGAVQGISTKPIYLDIQLPPESELTQLIPECHNAFVYQIEGEALFGKSQKESGQRLIEHQLGVLGKGDHMKIQTGKNKARFLLLAAKPIGEPIVRHGPFVMNTENEILEAFSDYHDGKIG